MSGKLWFKVGDKVKAAKNIGIAGTDEFVAEGTKGVVTEVYKPHYSCPYTVEFKSRARAWPVTATEIV